MREACWKCQAMSNDISILQKKEGKIFVHTLGAEPGPYRALVKGAGGSSVLR